MTKTDKKVREICEARGLHFKPWEVPPWEVDGGPSPWPHGTAGAISWKKAQILRKRLLDEAKP